MHSKIWIQQLKNHKLTRSHDKVWMNEWFWFLGQIKTMCQCTQEISCTLVLHGNVLVWEWLSLTAFIEQQTLYWACDYLLSDDTKPLPEPTLTYHQRCFCYIHTGAISQVLLKSIHNTCSKITVLKLECGTWYHHPRRLQCVLGRNLRICKVATWHYRCRHNLKK